MGFVNWVMENYGVVLTGFLALLACAAVFAKLTKTPKDDEIIADATSWLQKIKDFLKVK